MKRSTPSTSSTLAASPAAFAQRASLADRVAALEARAAADRGATELVLKAEEDIRRLRGRTTLLIAAADGVSYRVPDSTALDKVSRKLLERFL